MRGGVGGGVGGSGRGRREKEKEGQNGGKVLRRDEDGKDHVAGGGCGQTDTQSCLPCSSDVSVPNGRKGGSLSATALHVVGDVAGRLRLGLCAAGERAHDARGLLGVRLEKAGLGAPDHAALGHAFEGARSQRGHA